MKNKKPNKIAKSIDYPPMRGELTVYHSEDADTRAVCISGDPDGLRALGEILIYEANLDQTKIPNANLPPGEGHHMHLWPKHHLHPKSILLTIGRLDEKYTGKLVWWYETKRMKKERIIREFLSET